METAIYKLHANCILVKGFSRATICDLQRHKFYLIPNSLESLFNVHQELKFLEILQNLEESSKSTFKEYIDYLVQHQLAFKCSDKVSRLFAPLPTKWLFPSTISNCIIDIKTNLCFDEKILNELISVQCYHIQFRFFRPIEKEEADSILQLVKLSPIKSIEIILPFTPKSMDVETISQLLKTHLKISKIILYNFTSNEVIVSGRYGMGYLLGISQNIDKEMHCGIIHPDYFSINVSTYTESLSYNTCLNRKVSIDVDGNIKNCPSMKESFGNIKDTTLDEAINMPGFKKYWNITKDQISKCKDCEFRHICTDCRAYLENPDDVYSAPLKCGYDPYTCEWEEWSTNPLKEKAIEHYGIKEALIKRQ